MKLKNVDSFGVLINLSGKMHWKAIIAVVLVLAVISLLFVTDIGSQFTGLIGNELGNAFTSFLVLIKVKPSGGDYFSIVFSSDLNAFYGKSFNVVNSTFSIPGGYKSMKIGV